MRIVFRNSAGNVIGTHDSPRQHQAVETNNYELRNFGVSVPPDAFTVDFIVAVGGGGIVAVDEVELTLQTLSWSEDEGATPCTLNAAQCSQECPVIESERKVECTLFGGTWDSAAFFCNASVDNANCQCIFVTNDACVKNDEDPPVGVQTWPQVQGF